MKFLKIIFIAIALLCSEYKSYATYFTYEVKVEETQIKVIATPVLTDLYPANTCKWKFIWSYKNGTIQTVPKEVKQGEIYSYQAIFSYPIDDQFINAGWFGDEIDLTVVFYTPPATIGDDCVAEPPDYDFQYVSKDLGTTTILPTLDYSPKYPDGLPTKTSVNFNYMFVPGSNTNLDHLKYQIQIDGGGTVFNGGNLYPADFSKALTWQYQNGFSSVGPHKVELIVERFGVQVGYTSMNITVKADPPPTPDISSCVSGVNPALQVDSKVNTDDVELTFKDNSSSTFKSTFGGNSLYSIIVTDADNVDHIVAGGKNDNEFIYYPAGGFTSLTKTYDLSSIIKPSYTFTINFITQCKASGGTITRQYTTPVTINVPGKPFSSSENSVNIPPEGKLNQTVDIRAGYCKSLLLDQPDNQLENSNWVTNINLADNFLTFDAASNFDPYERTMGIKVFVNGYYDPCLAVEDGFTKTYRNIKVSQSSMLRDISGSRIKQPLPNNFGPSSIKYFSTQDQYSTQIAGYFYKEFPMDLATWNSVTNTSTNIIKGYDSNNKVVWQTTLTFIKYTCDDPSGGFFDVSSLGNTNNYFVLNVRTADKVEFVGAYQNGVIYVTSEQQIVFKPGFHAMKGALLDASIRSCSGRKSEMGEEDTLQSEISVLINDLIDPQVPQEENSVGSAARINIYPNPNEGRFSIDMQNLNENMLRIEIYNSAGIIQKILNNDVKSFETIDISSAPADMYLIKIITGGNIYFKKIIKL